jgi:uncharacterized protein YbaR (Trm112 family)
MTIELHDPCPMCNALLTYSSSAGSIVCPYCRNQLETGSSDPTGHHLYEIDPDIPGGALGEFQLHLIPPGTAVCCQCQQVYPKSFESCPKLVDLALAEFGHPNPDWGPNTQERIVEFLISKPFVVENTIKLRLLEAKCGKLKTKVTDQIRYCVQSIGLPYDVSKTDG